MAKATMGPIADCVTGKSEAILFSTTRKGQVLSNFQAAKNPKTPAQEGERNAFRAGRAIAKRGGGFLSEAWARSKRKRTTGGKKKGNAPGDTLFTGGLIQSTKGGSTMLGDTELLGQSLNEFTFIPATTARLPMVSLLSVPSDGQITLTAGPVTVPEGMRFTGYLYFIQRNLNPRGAFNELNYDAQFVFHLSTTQVFMGVGGGFWVTGVAPRFVRLRDRLVFWAQSAQNVVDVPS